MQTYPSYLPCVSRIEGLSVGAAAGVIRSPLEAGSPRQRRSQTQMPHRFALVFVVPQTAYASWVDWINNALAFEDWILIALPGLLASRAGTPTAPTPVRFVSDIQAELLPVHRRWVWRCRIDAEWMPAAGDLVPISLGNWIIAKLAQQQSWPAPARLFDFSRTPLDAAITFTRSTTATYFDAAGVLRTAAINTPRIDCDPLTGAALGLLIEAAATNLLLRSEDWTATWSFAAATVTADATVAPDGNASADRLVESTLLGNHQTVQTLAYTLGTTYTLSVFAKSSGRSQLRLAFPNSLFGATASAYFNLDAGTLISTAGAATTVSQVGNGWVRCSLTATCTTAGSAAVGLYTAAGGTSNYQGDGTSGIYLWGAQVEAATAATSYVRTTTTVLTRAVDVAVITGANFSSWWRQDEGTVAVVGRAFDPTPATLRVLAVAQDSGASTFKISRNGNSAKSNLNVAAASVSQVNTDIGPMPLNVASNIVATYRLNNYAARADSGPLVTDTVASVPTVDRLYFGTLSGGSGGALNGTIASLTYYASRVPLEGDIGPPPDWILAGTPPSPSSSNAILPGTPSAPSAWV